MSNASDIKIVVDRYWDDPVGYVHDVLGFEKLDQWQKDVLITFKSTKRIAIAGGTGIGKGMIIAMCALWYFCTKPKCKVIITSTNASTLLSRTFFDMRSIAKSSKIAHLFDYLQTELRFVGEKGENQSYIKCITGDPQNPESLRGFHANPYGHFLQIADECSYLTDNLDQALSGNMTHDENRWFAISNPTKITGPFFRYFSSPNWTCYNISSTDSSFVSPEYCESIEADYGKDSDVYRTKVLGQFPKQSFQTFIPKEWLQTCYKVKLDSKSYENFPIIMGVDVALTGEDDSVFCIRQGNKIHKFIRVHIPDTIDLENEIVRVFNREKCDLLAIDANGIGLPISQHLRTYIEESKIIKIISQSIKNVNPLVYKNKRNEMYHNLKKFIREEGEIPYCKEFEDELMAMETFLDDKNRVCLESKALMKNRGLPSPDHADSAALALAVDTDNLFKVETISRIQRPDRFSTKRGNGGSWMSR